MSHVPGRGPRTSSQICEWIKWMTCLGVSIVEESGLGRPWPYHTELESPLNLERIWQVFKWGHSDVGRDNEKSHLTTTAGTIWALLMSLCLRPNTVPPTWQARKWGDRRNAQTPWKESRAGGMIPKLDLCCTRRVFLTSCKTRFFKHGTMSYLTGPPRGQHHAWHTAGADEVFSVEEVRSEGVDEPKTLELLKSQPWALCTISLVSQWKWDGYFCNRWLF